MLTLYTDHFDSPLGKITLTTDGQALCALDFDGLEAHRLRRLQQRLGTLRLVPTDNPQGFTDLVRAYFAGDLHAIEGIPVKGDGTPFQEQVWHALRQIPVGSTTTYGDLAAQLGNRSASRAVGYANATNPIAIVVPCHRVIGAHAALTGYAGGLERKRWLLRHEQVEVAAVQLAFGF